MSTVAYLGPQGTFTEAALIHFFGDCQQLPVSSPLAAVEAVRSGEADRAVLAIENSVDGAVTPAFDALARGGVQIIGEHDIAIEFAIMTRPGFTGPVRTFATHPVGYQQVKGWVADNMPEAVFHPASSNAEAARQVSEGLIDAAAAPARAADIYGLSIIADGVADHTGATTRFVAVSPVCAPPARTGHDRTSVTFTLPDAPGTLVGALSEFAARGVDLSRIESRPTRERFGEYLFYVDLVGHIDDTPVAEALRAVYLRTEHLQFLGSWPAADTSVRAGFEEADAWVDAARGGA
ncbi:prephenate dehydratase [Corynebacterium renale]|uniref:Prephenate dehydratase n=1 Tax=Corynebacterium renale TaxID=1724 RepID=A0A2A9DM04_9CORY|nr:prephenate dehydratase [Corynebacterium renale]PFG27777.1 prephenate dehydratase [Corynebacterium renale]SQI22106.1 prephenate dehydratase [Corynebacterium renale]